MNFRFGSVASILVICVAASLLTSGAELHNPPIAKVLVWVRDAHDAPVANLSAADFIVTENGVADRVVGVERFFSGAQTQSPNAAARANSTAGTDPKRDDSGGTPTHVLVLIEPMPAVSRNHAIADALRFFSRAPEGNWRIGLVDDEGNFLRYSTDLDQIRSALKRLEKHYAPHASHTPWSVAAQSTIRELGVLPGRHVIILISSRSPMPPSMLVGLAISSQAAMYTIDSSGPATVVPFDGTAGAGPIPFFTGEFAAESLAGTLSGLGYINTGLGQLGFGAEETGGLPVDDVKDAFEHISADAAGYYLVSFEAQAQESGGAFNAISVSVKRPHLNVKGPRYYIIPPDAESNRMPAEMKAALQSEQNQKALSVVANSWLFPDQGSVHWGVFAADLQWLEGARAKGSPVKIFAELINDSMHGLSGTWVEDEVWPGADSVIHWQREGRVYPGTYMLRVTAMDTASGKIASDTRIFTARPLDVPAFRFSGIVLADECLPSTERATLRRNLFDPLLLDGCKLAPAANARFRSDENVRILVRMYPPGEKISRLVLAQWKAYAVVDDVLERATELKITPAEVRGLSVSGVLALNQLHLAQGKHRLTVLYLFPGKNSQGQKIPLQTEFSVE